MQHALVVFNTNVTEVNANVEGRLFMFLLMITVFLKGVNKKAQKAYPLAENCLKMDEKIKIIVC